MAFDLDDRWALHPSVALRPEPFGALAYHFGNRRLSFLKSRALVAVVENLASAPSGRAACAAAGVEVAYCLVTDGEAGGDDRTMDRAEMAALRRDEQRAAADCVGVTDLTFLGYPDGRLEPTIPLRRDLVRGVRRVPPPRGKAPPPAPMWDPPFPSPPDHPAARARGAAVALAGIVTLDTSPKVRALTTRICGIISRRATVSEESCHTRCASPRTA